jgi:chromosome segregation ATPase
MNRYFRISLWILVGVIVVLFAGFYWGRSGRSALEARVRDAEASARSARTLLDLAQARAALLAARVDVFEVNFGEASREIESAKAPLQSAADELQSAGRNDEAKQVNDVLAQISKAQDAVNRLDQTANTQLAGAISTLEDVHVEAASARQNQRPPGGGQLQ